MTWPSAQKPARSALLQQNTQTGGRDVDDLKLQLGDKRPVQLGNGDEGNNSPIASLVTQVSRTPQTRVASPMTTTVGYTPTTPSGSTTPYATPVGNEPTLTQIDTTKKPITPYQNNDEDDALDLNAIQFSVPTPQTPSTGRSPATPGNKSPTQSQQLQSPNSPKRNKLLNYLLKSISWCFSTNTPPAIQNGAKTEEDDIEEVEETTSTVHTKTVVRSRRTSKSKREEEPDEQVEVEEESWSSKRLTMTKKKKSNGGSPTNAVTRSPSTPTNVAAAPTAGRTLNKSASPQKFLLGEQSERVRGRKCLVLDLDETLVHSCFQPIPNPDFVIPIEIEGTRHMVYVLKRPFVDDFMLEMSKVFEIVIFTASLSKYANPLLDQLDKHNVISARLFREHCTFIDNCYIKDLSRLGRDITQTLIIDNSPTCYALQPQNAMAVTTWFDCKKDTQLQQMTPWLVKMGDQRDVFETLQEYRVYYSQNGWSGNQHW